MSRTGSRHAVLCGIGDYGGQHLPVPDVKGSLNRLQKLFDEELHTDFRYDKVSVYEDKQLRAGPMRTILRDLAVASPVEEVFLYITGQATVPNRQPYFATYGADADTPGLPLTELSDYLEAIHARVVFAVLDFCHAGAIVEPSTVPGGDTEKVALLAACRASERAAVGNGVSPIVTALVEGYHEATAAEGLVRWGDVTMHVLGCFRGSTMQVPVDRSHNLRWHLVNRVLAKGPASSQSLHADRAPARSAILPRAPRCVGREAIVRQIVYAALAEDARPIAVLGPGGIGKSAVTLLVLHEPAVQDRFGDRRLFVRCETAVNATMALDAIGEAIGLEAAPERSIRVAAELARAPALVVMDNAETPWEADPVATESALGMLGGIPGVAMIASVRGDELPGGADWGPPVRIPRLAPSEAREMFCQRTHGAHRHDGRLDDLLRPLDGLPLAIDLMAHVSEGEPDLGFVFEEWQKHRTAALSRFGDGKRASLAASIELSIQSRRMTPRAKEVLSTLALLPAGTARTDLGGLFGEDGFAVTKILRQVGLVHHDGDRIRMFGPIQEYAMAAHSAAPELKAMVCRFYMAMTRRVGPEIFGRQGATAKIRLSAEIGNLEAMIQIGLDAADPSEAVRSATALRLFYRSSGQGTGTLLEQAKAAAHALNDIGGEAHCIFSLGDLALARSDHETARACYEKARPMHRTIGDVRGEANCIKGLGDIELERSAHDKALGYYGEAQRMYRQVGDVLGNANCIRSVGDISLVRSEHEKALEYYGEAQPMYRQVGNVFGEAHCIFSRGEIARACGEETARELYDKAERMYRQVGAAVGEAHCMFSLGEIARARPDHEAARELYEKAQPMFRQVGDVRGEAYCIMGLGEIARARPDHQTARELYEKAQAMCRQVSDVRGEANCMFGLGEIARARSDHEAARALYEKALPMYRQVADVLGEANCIRMVGAIGLECTDPRERGGLG